MAEQPEWLGRDLLASRHQALGGDCPLPCNIRGL